MTSEGRSSVENGIWLCATHATQVDRDVVRYTVEVLGSWKRQHEAYVQENIGERPSKEATPTLNGRTISIEAARIVAERSLGWSHRLFGQLLRDEIASSRDEARDLKYGIVVSVPRVLQPPELPQAIRSSMHDATSALKTFTRLIETVSPMA